MKILVLTQYAENYNELADVTVPVLKKYCERHGYDLCVHKIEMPYHYKKHYVIEKLNNYDLVFYIDIDAMVTNHKIKIESFLNEEKDFYITKDLNELNGGVFMLTLSEWGKVFNSEVLSNIPYFENEQNYYNSVYENHSWKDKISVLPQSAFNSYPYQYYGERFGKISGDKPVLKPSHEQGDWKIGDFVIHVPGLELSIRESILSEVKRHIVYE